VPPTLAGAPVGADVISSWQYLQVLGQASLTDLPFRDFVASTTQYLLILLSFSPTHAQLESISLFLANL
jgi:hypothetical protein